MPSLKKHRRGPRTSATGEGGEVRRPPAGYEAGEPRRRDMRPAGLPGGPLLVGRRGKGALLRDDPAGAGGQALAGGDADLHGLLDAVRDGGDAGRDALGDARDPLRHDVLATVGLALDRAGLALEGAAVAADQALDARAGEAGLPLATALEATDVLL